MQRMRFELPRAGESAKGPVVILMGKRGTGKSVLIKDIMYNNREVPLGTVISGTEEGNGFYSSFVPKMFINGEYSTTIVESILKRQLQVIREIHKEEKQFGRSSIDPRAFLIMDDCMYDASWTREKVMWLLFMNGRHWRIMLLISMQYPLGIPPILRTNVDFVFILRENIVSNRKRLYDHYVGMIETFELFQQIMNQCTENYECLVVDNTVQSNNPMDQIFWYKANMNVPQFRIGCRDYWEMSAQMELIDEENNTTGEKQYKPGSLTKKRGGARVEINKRT